MHWVLYIQIKNKKKMRRNIEFARFSLNFRSFLPLITRDESRDVACRLDRVLLRALECRRSTLPFAKSLLKEKYCDKVLVATKVPVQEFAKHSQLKL